jgi:hypothetical protein
MAVQSTLKIIYKALPIRINEDGSVAVTVRTGYINAEQSFVQLNSIPVVLDIAQAGAILQAQATPGKTRWDDLSDALYGHLIAQGYIQGEIV